MTQDKPTPGERIAKVIARSGRASRRDAEKLITEGRVSVNGAVIDRAALNVGPRDKIAIDGLPLDAPEPARLWLYHKPTGLVTTARDEQGRPTIYDDLPEDMPRVMSIGRLDLNSEGLLLLTNDGGLKRQLELPSTGWLRKYRVRVNGRVNDPMLEPLRRGISSRGENFLPMTVTLDRQQGANAWLTVGLREGKNREIRRAMEEIGLSVNRLIRVSYGPFQLGQIKPGDVEEVRRRVLRDQLGLPPETEAEAEPAARPRVTRARRKPEAPQGHDISDTVAARGKPGARRTGPTTGPSTGPSTGKGAVKGAGKGTGAGKPGPRGDKPGARPERAERSERAERPGATAKPGDKPGTRRAAPGTAKPGTAKPGPRDDAAKRPPARNAKPASRRNAPPAPRPGKPAGPGRKG